VFINQEEEVFINQEEEVNPQTPNPKPRLSSTKSAQAFRSACTTRPLRDYAACWPDGIEIYAVDLRKFWLMLSVDVVVVAWSCPE